MMKLKNKIKFQAFTSMKTAFLKVLKDINNSRIPSKKIILFSPCSASFDQFKNFEERGAYFNFLVKSFKNRLWFNITFIKKFILIGGEI